MKFMKLGSKPDAFLTEGNDVRFVASDLATDVIICVGDVKFHLHKFPLLSKSYRLQKLVHEASEDGTDEVYISDFPGGPKAFEICAKFCYGMTVTLNAYNVVAARCAAEYLEMTEDVEKGNLIYKIEVFLNSSVFRSWKDSIIVLQTTKSLLPWSEELKIVGRCIDSIASKTSVDPSLVNWSYTYSKRSTNQIVELYPNKTHVVPKDWWVEDICELDVDLYKRVMVAIKSKGRMSPELIGEALKAYAVRWLPDSYDALVSDDYMIRNKSLVETLIWLLPKDKSSGCSCRFLLKLLKIVILVEAGDLLKEELMNRISSQLHKASVKDLLIPTRANGDTLYDIDLVRSLVTRFLVQEGPAHDPDIIESEQQKGEYILGHASLLNLGKLIDGYLAEIASDPNLPISSFIGLSTLLPAVARPVHDGLYTAIDIYLKEHPNLPKAEKRSICCLMDVKKLSPEASIHAAQNDRLPLRVVVQVLFFEQLRASAAAITNENSHGSARTTSANIEEHWERPAPEEYKSIKKQLKTVKIEDNNNTNSKNKIGGGLLLPSRSRRIFDKLWSGKGQGENNRSSETSGSSQSPPSSSANPLDASKSSGSSSRNNRRHSVS
ncbi:uncharacterized protein A4U43_C05F17650 [Asparagus officinalis]|uniref:NPH3 domain-containing protein n=1 Tax=Asparagus officinalis TaxID=4686 RepID=A0A5P1ETE9_ASPOF|nr:BTB/POZ domain-containing protein NPY1 [Asparagus officinalis]ONK68943.1 uncharacterized protein A4U43_C05F17650 [Asparagus officinalis]